MQNILLFVIMLIDASRFNKVEVNLCNRITKAVVNFSSADNMINAINVAVENDDTSRKSCLSVGLGNTNW